MVAHSEVFVILACTVLIQITSVTDGQTDGQTYTWTMAKMRKALHTVAHSNVAMLNSCIMAPG